MSDSQGIRNFFGENFLFQHGVELVGEKIHIGFNILYVFFLITFGVSYTTNYPSCYPVNSTDVSVFSEVEATFISDQCISQAPWYFTPNNIRIGMILFLFYLEVFPNLFFITNSLVNTVAVYAKMEKTFYDFGLDMEDSWEMAMQPDLLQDQNSPYKKLRQITLELWLIRPGFTKFLILGRELYLTSLMLIFSLLVLGVFGIGLSKAEASPLFFCNLDLSAHTVLCNSAVFMCTFPYKDRDWTTMYFYIVIVFSHCLVRIIIFSIRTIQSRVKKIKSKLTKEAQRTRECVLFLTKIWFTSRAGYQEDFNKFVKAIFSDRLLSRMHLYIKLIGTKIDSRFTYLVSKIAKKQYNNVMPNLSEMVDELFWEVIVILLNRNFNFPDAYLFTNVNMSKLDVKEFSLLYYALNRKPGSETFNPRALKVLLPYIPIENRIVCCPEGKFTAKEFVLEQYVTDSTYPERLKDHLIQMIETNPTYPDNLSRFEGGDAQQQGMGTPSGPPLLYNSPQFGGGQNQQEGAGRQWGHENENYSDFQF